MEYVTHTNYNGRILSDEAVTLMQKLPVRRPRQKLSDDDYKIGVQMGAYGLGIIRVVVDRVVRWELTELGEFLLEKELVARNKKD